MTLGPILGDEKCAHRELTYYRSGYTGNYAVCADCGGHLWGDTEDGIEIPPGIQVIDLDAEDDEPDDDSPQYPIPTQERLDAWKKSVQGWNA